MKKVCCFAGHSQIYNTEEIFTSITEKIENLIVNEKVTHFYVGNYGSFDKLSARAVRTLKEKYSHITLALVIPYLTKEITDEKAYNFIYLKNPQELVLRIFD